MRKNAKKKINIQHIWREREWASENYVNEMCNCRDVQRMKHDIKEKMKYFLYFFFSFNYYWFVMGCSLMHVIFRVKQLNFYPTRSYTLVYDTQNEKRRREKKTMRKKNRMGATDVLFFFFLIKNFFFLQSTHHTYRYIYRKKENIKW